MNEQEKEYLNNSILKPYLIHVEFELDNILNYILKDNKLREIYTKKGFSLIALENSLRKCVKSINRLQSIFRFN